MQLRQLELFVVLADELHFGHAAERMFVSASTYSEQISKLELELGVPLFQRSSRKVELSSAGEQLLGSATKVVEEIRRLESMALEVRRGGAGGLRLAYSGGTGRVMLSLLYAMEPYSGQSNLLIEHMPGDHVLRDIESGMVDLGIASSRAAGAGSLILCEDDVHWVVLPPQHAYANRDVIAIEDLEGVSLVVADYETHPETHRRIVGSFERFEVHPQFYFYRGRAEEDAINLVLAGKGLALASGPHASHCRDAGLVLRRLTPNILGPSKYYLVWGNAPSGRTQEFIDRASEVVPVSWQGHFDA